MDEESYRRHSPERLLLNAEEAFGRATGNTRLEAEGAVNCLSGAAQDLYGQARDSASDMAETARAGASSFENLLRNTIEQQPYAAAAPLRLELAGCWVGPIVRCELASRRRERSIRTCSF